MRNALACFGGLGLLALVGHAELNDATGDKYAVLAPAWVMLPEGGEVLSVALDGGPGNEASMGYIDVAVAEKTDRVLSSLQSKLVQRGYRVEKSAAGADVLFGAADMIVASDPVTGRKIRFVELNTPAGSVLRVFFNDPAPEFAQIGS